MTREDIINMARQAGFATSWSQAAGDALERFAELVAAAEREACKKLCQEVCDNEFIGSDKWDRAYDCMEAIEIRGEK